MGFAVVAAAVIIVVGLFYAVVTPRHRPANAPESWTPNTRRALGVGMALGGVILLVIVLLV